MSEDYSTLDKEPDGATWKLSAPGCAPLRLANGLTAYSVKSMVEHAYQAGRADAFRALMATCEDRATTLLVGHWAFIQALTGISLANGEILEFDPSA